MDRQHGADLTAARIDDSVLWARSGKICKSVNGIYLMEMNKEFDEWNIYKKILHRNINEIYFHEKEVWICSLGINIGHEQDGKNEKFIRPIIILKKYNGNIFCSLPMTSKEKTGLHYLSFDFKGKTSTVILSQIRTLDKKRLIRKIGMISAINFEGIRERVRAQI